MPTMTNPETGETKEISMEEFLAAMKNGQVSVRQEVRHADGTVTSSVIYGNDAGDGVDRSVNIFGEMADVLMPAIQSARKVKEADENAQKLFFMDNADADYEMTVDDTKIPAMHIVTCTREWIKVARYIRDGQRTVGKPTNEKTFPFVDGKLDAALEDIQGNSLLLFAFGAYELRKMLAAQGLLQELQKLGNRSCGVLLKKDGEDISMKIVRGRNRPELPCMPLGGLFAQSMDDAVMMRPYADEMMQGALHAGMSLEEKIQAAEEGDPDLMEELAQSYLNGDDVPQDFEKSAYWWEKLAQTGNAVGQFNTGLHYAKGCGVKRDFQKAAQWMRKAAESGDEDAPDVAALYSGAAETLKKAEQGDAAAQAAIAKLYTQIGGSLDQFGSQADFAESFKWAQKAAAQGDLDGMYCLALCYEHGRGTAVAKTKAATTYEQAAKLGHAPSQWNLAVCYFNGSGYVRNEVKGYMWAYQAAEQGNELAINGLSYQEKTLEQMIAYYEDPENGVALEGTQYEGRAARCESLHAGTKLTYQITRDKNDEEVIELFHNGGSVGLLSRWNSAALLALLKLERIDLTVTVKSCIPKSKRGPRARNADVQLYLAIYKRKPETPEERAARLEREEAERIAEAERKRKAAEEKKRQEEARRKAEQLRKEREAAEKAEAERIAKEKAKALEEAAEKMRDRYLTAAGMIASSYDHVVAVKPDGTVIATGKNDEGQCNVSGWRDVIAVACESRCTVGLTKSGRVLYTGSTYHRQNQCTGWSGIKEIAISQDCIFGLRHNGTVVATTEGNNGANFSSAADVSTWRNIVAIRAGQGHVLGIQADGKIVAIQRNYYGRCEPDYYLDGATDVRDAAFGYLACGVVLHKDGKCTSSGTQYSYVMSPKTINTHSGIVKVDMYGSRPVAILADGTLAVESSRDERKKELEQFISRNHIEKVAAVSCSGQFAVLTADGRVYVKGGSGYSDLREGECFGQGFRLFHDFNSLMDQREAEAERIRKEKEEMLRRLRIVEQRQAEYRQKGLCQQCGGTFKKVLFGKKCTACGARKDY